MRLALVTLGETEAGGLTFMQLVNESAGIQTQLSMNPMPVFLGKREEGR